MNNTDPLSEEYPQIYDELLQNISERPLNWMKLTGFWPMVGNLYEINQGLMVVGRAVNGWEKPNNWWECSEVKSPTKRQEIIGRLRTIAKQEIGWVNMPVMSKGEYNPKRSAFWRVIRLVGINGCQLCEDDWSHHIAWTNLCKISPAEGGNPSSWLWDAQLEYCIELFSLEIKQLKPARVLVLAGEDWYRPFREKLGIPIIKNLGGFVEGVGRLDNAQWIFAKHPQGKPEQQFVREIIENFR